MPTTVNDHDPPMERTGLHRKHFLDLERRVERYYRTLPKWRHRWMKARTKLAKTVE